MKSREGRSIKSSLVVSGTTIKLDRVSDINQRLDSYHTGMILARQNGADLTSDASPDL